MHALAAAEPTATALLLLVFAILILFSVLFSRTLNRVGVPVVLLFLLLGMLGGSEGIGGVHFDDYNLAFRFGTIALILILFDGGLNTAQSAIRRSILPAGLLATAGVVLTAGVVALAARLFGLAWSEAILIGVIVSSTDAAAVFAVLRGGSIRVKDPARSAIEVESCINDPMAVLLTVTAVEVLRSTTPISPWLLLQLPAQLIIGGAVGAIVGAAGRFTLSRVTLSTAGLYPVATLAIAFLAFGLATVAHGSGFLAVFTAGAILGNGSLPYKAGLTRVHDAVAWFAQVAMFLMLGLLSFPSRLLDVAGIGLALALVLAFLARPIAVAACLAPLGWKRSDLIYTGWIGIRGAVPIILATIPIMSGIPGSERVFDVVFFIVALSAIVPGASIIPVTRALGLEDERRPQPSALLEVHSRRRMDGDFYIYRIDPSTAVCGAALAEVSFPENASILLIVRDDTLLPARGRTTIQPGDFIYVFCRPEDEPHIGLLFGPTVGR